MDCRATYRFLLPTLMCLIISALTPALAISTTHPMNLNSGNTDSKIGILNELNATASPTIHDVIRADSGKSASVQNENVNVLKSVDNGGIASEKQDELKLKVGGDISATVLSAKPDEKISTLDSKSSSGAALKSANSDFPEVSTSAEPEWTAQPEETETTIEYTTTYETQSDTETTSDIASSYPLEDTTAFNKKSSLSANESALQVTATESTISASTSSNSANDLPPTLPSSEANFYSKYNFSAKYRALYDPKFSSAKTATTSPKPSTKKTLLLSAKIKDQQSVSNASSSTDEKINFKSASTPTVNATSISVTENSLTTPKISNLPATKTSETHISTAVPDKQAKSFEHGDTTTDAGKTSAAFNITLLSDESVTTPVTITNSTLSLDDAASSNSTVSMFSTTTSQTVENNSTGGPWPNNALSTFIDSMKHFTESGANKTGFNYSKYNTKPGTFTSTTRPTVTESPKDPSHDAIRRRHSGVSAAMITSVVLSALLLVTCVIMTIFAVQWYHNQKSRDDSMSLVSGRHGYRRPYYYYDTTM